VDCIAMQPDKPLCGLSELDHSGVCLLFNVCIFELSFLVDNQLLISLSYDSVKTVRGILATAICSKSYTFSGIVN
jgi:hypothetical protein